MEIDEQPPPHTVSAARIVAAAEALAGFATTYSAISELDVSPAERSGLARAADLADEALTVFAWDD